MAFGDHFIIRRNFLRENRAAFGKNAIMNKSLVAIVPHKIYRISMSTQAPGMLRKMAVDSVNVACINLNEIIRMFSIKCDCILCPASFGCWYMFINNMQCNTQFAIMISMTNGKKYFEN